MSVACRVFEHRRIWRLTPDALCKATTMLADAVAGKHGAVDHVIGIAEGGAAPARLIAAALGLRVRMVRARHNASAATYQQATGKVHLDLAPLTRSLNGQPLTGQPLTGRILLVDDICGSGATLNSIRHALLPLTAPSAQVVTATLCLNTGAATQPDYSIWTVADWVIFPWEPPAGRVTLPLLNPQEALRHA